ncbi:MAG: hypothetical protein NVSMB55_15410 [Mycobacteriales bacterium]
MAVAIGLVLLAGCSSSGSPAADLQIRMNAVVDAANAKDAAALRTTVGELLQVVEQQSANGDITATKAQDLRTVGTRLLAEASVFEAVSPAPSPSPVVTAAPAPSPSPRPRYSPAPSPSPTEAPTPSGLPSIGFGSSPAASPTP